MSTTVKLSIGNHLVIENAVDWMVALVPETQPPEVKLTVSISDGSNPPLFPTRGIAATTLAIQMDAQVAIALYERLEHLGHSMGWLPQKEDGHLT